MISKLEEEQTHIEELRARQAELEAEGEPTINIGGVPVPLSMAGLAVGRCIRAIQAVERWRNGQEFASKEDLDELLGILKGEDE